MANAPCGSLVPVTGIGDIGVSICAKIRNYKSVLCKVQWVQFCMSPIFVTIKKPIFVNIKNPFFVTEKLAFVRIEILIFVKIEKPILVKKLKNPFSSKLKITSLKMSICKHMKRQPWSTQNKRMLAYPPSPLSPTPAPKQRHWTHHLFIHYKKTDFFFQRDNANTGRQFSKGPLAWRPWREYLPTMNSTEMCRTQKQAEKIFLLFTLAD